MLLAAGSTNPILNIDGSSHFGSSVFCSSVFWFLRSYFVSLRLAHTVLKEQVDALKNPRTDITYQEQHPKPAGTKAWDRYGKYKTATTVAEAKNKKTGWQDLTNDFEKGFIKIWWGGIYGNLRFRSETPSAQGTPHKEAHASTKSQHFDFVPRVLPTEAPNAISKVEMSAATIATLPEVIREEIASGMEEMEGRMIQRMEDQLGQAKAEPVAEREAREAFKVAYISWRFPRHR